MGILDKYLPDRELMKEEPPQGREAPLRRPTASAVGEDGYIWRQNVPKGGFPYDAFSAPAQHQPPFLMLARRGDSYPCPNYDRLDHIEIDPGGTWLLLVYSHEVVNIKGRNLHPLAERLLDKQVELIVQFNPEKYAPLLEDRPIVTEIEQWVTRTASEGEVRALTARIAKLERMLNEAVSEEA